MNISEFESVKTHSRFDRDDSRRLLRTKKSVFVPPRSIKKYFDQNNSPSDRCVWMTMTKAPSNTTTLWCNQENVRTHRLQFAKLLHSKCPKRVLCALIKINCHIRRRDDDDDGDDGPPCAVGKQTATHQPFSTGCGGNWGKQCH